MGRFGEIPGKRSLWLGLLINEFYNIGTQAGFPVAGLLKIFFPCCQGNTRTDDFF